MSDKLLGDAQQKQKKKRFVSKIIFIHRSDFNPGKHFQINVRGCHRKQVSSLCIKQCTRDEY
jgi:hypothetical protein